MPSKQSQKPRGRVKSSIVLRLNLRLFLRLLGIYVFMDLLLLLLTGGGVLLWADRQCADVSALVEERGVPSAEATVWMAAGDYTVSALTEPPDRVGFLLNGAYFNLGSLRDDPLSGSLRTLAGEKCKTVFHVCSSKNKAVPGCRTDNGAFFTRRAVNYAVLP